MTTTINASTSAGLVQTADTSGALALQTAGTTALSISASQVVTLTNALPVASGGSGVTTSTGTGANVLGTSPTITTPVISSLSSASATALTLQSAGTTAITVDTSQRVGIGTTAPNKPLSVYGGDGYIQMLNASTGTGNTDGSFIGVEGGTTALRIVNQENDVMSFHTNGLANERMRIDSSGNLLVGTTSNPTNLKIVASGTDNNNLIGSYNTASGNAGIRIQANQAGLYLQGSGTVDPLYITNSSSTGYIVFRPGSDTERVRLVANGTFMVGTTSETPAGSGDSKGIALNNSSTSSQIYATGNSDTCAVFNRATTDGAVVRLRRQGSDVGSISVNGTNTTYNTSSDYRLKENITPMTGALAKVALLKPVTYKWKVNGSDGEGFIAHELAEVKPDCVSGDKDATRQEEYEVTPAVKDKEGNITTPAVMGTRTVPVYQGIDTSFLVATLTAAIQELKTIVDAQAATITTLAARITALEGN